eukprot:TRINITY_DN13333_c0_g1_i1.p1 TRINITY_DN13333_c0_g1~~TRINITY_DN13333_c0_g1_i1.p1  ORF type:complete len:114 (+),score=19.84 TRINITY_DN13333_c0_g1_i1:41-382(+)
MGVCITKQLIVGDEEEGRRASVSEARPLKGFDRQRYQSQQRKQKQVMKELHLMYTPRSGGGSISPSQVRSITGKGHSNARPLPPPAGAIDFKTICFSPEKEKSHCVVYLPVKT